MTYLVDFERPAIPGADQGRSEEHTSELQSLRHLVCRLLLEKKNETADVRRRDEDVVMTRQVIGVWRAQKTDTVGEKSDSALHNDVSIAPRQKYHAAAHPLLR